MRQVLSVLNWILRMFKEMFINILDFFAYNSFYKFLSCVIVLFSCYFQLVGVSILFWNGVWNFILMTWILGWTHENSDLIKENRQLRRQLREINKNNYNIVIEDLASTMHNIWTDDVYQLENPTKGEIERANTLYCDLSESDKEYNRKKASRIIKQLCE